MRKALVVGIDYYDQVGSLTGCVNDAHSVRQVLATHSDGSVNFSQPRLIVGTGSQDIVERSDLKEAIRELFVDDSEVALFYFAGHGYIEATGGYLCAGDCKTGDDGVPLADIMMFANESPARNKIIILDSCYGGALGDSHTNKAVAEIHDGVTILTASTKGQYAAEVNGGGVFTGLLIDALNGAASNLVGEVTPGSVYAHIDQSLGPWAQRPVFKTNVKRFVSLRKVTSFLELQELQQIAKLFPEPGFQYQLDPTYEPERPKIFEPMDVPPPNPEKTPIFAILQKYNRVGLLIPEGVPHMWHAAMQNKTVRLTALGEHYRRLAADKLI